jgi:hypothetical protein
MRDPSDPRLSAFEKDVESLARDMEDLAHDLSEDSRLVGEEMVGAELLATRELVENLGIVWETLEAMNDLCVRQLSYLAADHGESWRMLVANPRLEQLPALAASHCQRRLEHLAQGVSEVSRLVVKSSDDAATILFSLWKPFFAVIDSDWRGKREAGR